MAGPLVIVSGAIANKPFNGGETWVRISWLRALERCGFRVFLLEQIAPDTCVDAAGRRTSFSSSTNLAYFDEVVQSFALRGRAALFCADGSALWGIERDALDAVCEHAVLLLNISGHLHVPHLFDRVSRRAFIDIDPGYTQIWDEQGLDAAHLRAHDSWFTIGENIGSPICAIPTNGVAWQPTRQPVIVEDWSTDLETAPPAAVRLRFTTIAAWRGAYGRVAHDGRTYGLKAHEFRKFADLPRRARADFEIALDIHDSDRADAESLTSHGWRLVDPRAASGSPARFRAYIRQSGGEFSVAQGIYVETASGWFSDRSLRYMAAGRPVLVQDTGFTRNIPSGHGLVPFRTMEEAIGGVDTILTRYDQHAQAARELAETSFSARHVIPSLVERALS